MNDAAAIAARRWIGTPYRHRASRRGAGCDCLGLILGVWAEIGGPVAINLPPYSPDWGEPDRRERLWAALEGHLVSLPEGPPMRGDVLLFRMREAAVAKHLGIVTATGDLSFVHAHAGAGVIESRLGPPWLRRLAARFAFPEGGQ